MGFEPNLYRVANAAGEHAKPSRHASLVAHPVALRIVGKTARVDL